MTEKKKAKVKKESSGCVILDVCGITTVNEGIIICLDCPRDKVGLECLLMEKKKGGKR